MKANARILWALFTALAIYLLWPKQIRNHETERLKWLIGKRLWKHQKFPASEIIGAPRIGGTTVLTGFKKRPRIPICDLLESKAKCEHIVMINPELSRNGRIRQRKCLSGLAPRILF